MVFPGGNPERYESQGVTAGADKPDRELADPKEVLLGFLDYYRSVMTRKFEGVPDAELRASRLPSGWAPLELLKHLAFMEQRWLRWGDSRPTLAWILAYVLQEYARHAGHLDIARELIDGSTGE
jgi:hypothetical protein